MAGKHKRVSLDEIGRRVDAVRLKPPFGYIGVQTSVRDLKGDSGVSASVMGCISMHHWGMELGVNTGWRPESDTYIKEFLQAKGVSEQGVIVVAEDASRHEFGHPKYCPLSLESFTFIKNAVAEEMQKLGIKSEDTVHYTTNAFMDFIDNANVRAGGDGQGLTIFYYNQGDSEFFSSFIALNMLCWGDDADRDLIMRKFSANLDKAKMDNVMATATAFALRAGLLERTHSGLVEKTFEQKMKLLNDPTKWEALARLFVHTLGKLIRYKEGGQSQQGQQGGQQQGQQGQKQGQAGQQQGQKGQKQGQQQGQKGGQQGSEGEEGEEGEESDQAGRLKRLREKIKDMMKRSGKGGQGEEKQEDEGEGREGDGQQQGKPGKQDGKDSGQKGGEGEKEGDEEGEGEEKEEPGKHMGKYHEQTGTPSNGSKETDKVDEPGTSAGDNPFDKEAETEEGKRKAVEAMMKAGKGLPKFMDPDEAIDIYYEMIAKPIPIEAASQNKGMAFPIIPYGAKEFDPEKDEPEMISGIRIGEDGSRMLEAYSDVMDINAPLVERPVTHPDVCMIIDSSQSMQVGGGNSVVTASKGNQAWGDQSGYHYALKSAHGIRNALRAKNILPFIRMNVVIFSDSTTSTGWQDYSQGAQCRTPMTKPLFGGTQLNADELERQLGDREPSVVVLISDGVIANWDQDKQRIMQILSRHYVAFVRIGGETQASKDMKNAGFEVVPVTSDRDLEDKVINVTDQMYKAIGAQQSLESDWMVPK